MFLLLISYNDMIFDNMINYFIINIMTNYFTIHILTNCTQTMQFPWNVKPVVCTEHPIWPGYGLIRGCLKKFSFHNLYFYCALLEINP